MIGLATEVSIMEMVIVKDCVLEVIEIDRNDIDIEIDLIK